MTFAGVGVWETNETLIRQSRLNKDFYNYYLKFQIQNRLKESKVPDYN